MLFGRPVHGSKLGCQSALLGQQSTTPWNPPARLPIDSPLLKSRPSDGGAERGCK
ncbi:hypothetical protein CGRA01v4_06351 [Colletotrichum graminicola]|nr:hypothetical protein CGRA01v4_06351 [Colletotrichum graminicola]